MNILYIGEETRNWIVRFANEMSLLGHEITIVVKKYDIYDNFNKVKPIDNVSLIEVDDGAYFVQDTIANMIGDKIKEFDIVYGSHIIACLPVAYIGKKYNIPYGNQVLDVPIHLIKTQPQRNRNWNAYSTILKQANTMTFITKKARDDWNIHTGQYYPDDNVITYPATVPKDYKNIGIDIKSDYVVSVCGLSPIKNISMITEAIALTGRPIRQVVIGRDRGDKQRIIEIAKANNIDVSFYDSVSEESKFEWIKNAMCVVYPQQTEYIGGLNPWEGMMIGTPVICTDYEILKDLYKDNVTYFDRASVQALANELINVYDNEYDKDKLKSASDYAYENACFEIMAKKFDTVIKKVVKK